MVHALLFDFDGVLGASEEPRFNALQAIAASHHVSIPDTLIHQSIGKTSLAFLTEVLPDNPELVTTILNDFASSYMEHITEYVQPIAFTVGFIRDYHGDLPIAIASMSSQRSLKKLTSHFGIASKISLIVSRDDITHHKPHPEIYLKTAELLHCKPSECLVFEDTVLGVQAALAAGMRCCVVLTKYNHKELFAGLPIVGFVATQRQISDVLHQVS